MLRRIGSIFLIGTIATSCTDKITYEKSKLDIKPKEIIGNISTISELSKHVTSNQLKEIEIRNATLDYLLQDFTLDFDISHVIFNNCNIKNFSVSNSLTNVIFKDCSFDQIQISNSDFHSVRFDNCIISDIIISSSTLIHFHVNSISPISKFSITNCNNCYDVKLKGQFERIETAGGEISFLDLSMLDTIGVLKIDGTRLDYPSFQNHISTNISIIDKMTIYAQSFSELENFKLKEQLFFEEIDTDDSYLTSRNEIRERFRSVESTYNKLSNKFNVSNNRKLANYFKFKELQFHSELNHGKFSQLITKIWHEYFRGNYGSSVVPITLAFILVWFLFGTIYFILALLNIAVISYSFNVKGLVKTYVVSVGAKYTNITNALSNCFYYSMSEMFSGGITSNIKIGNFSNNYQSPPRVYTAIGVGRIIALIQNILGIILIFNFITILIKIGLN